MFGFEINLTFHFLYINIFQIFQSLSGISGRLRSCGMGKVEQKILRPLKKFTFITIFNSNINNYTISFDIILPHKSPNGMFIFNFNSNLMEFLMSFQK